MKRHQFDRPVLWHVMGRGARRLGLFWEVEDFRFFLGLLSKSTQESGAQLVGYTLMSNHFHMILQATSLELTACMRRLDYGYSRFHNERHDLSGHTFDGPYQAYAQPTPRLALRKLAYVFLNPVRAGMKISEFEYPWSNIGDFLGGRTPPLSGTLTPLLGSAASSFVGIRALLERDLELERVRGEARKPGLPTAKEVQSLHYEWLRDLAQERRSELLGLDPIRVAKLWARNYGVSPAAIAAVEAGKSARGISQELWSLRRDLREKGTLEQILRLAS